jgi:hypothetical protein
MSIKKLGIVLFLILCVAGFSLSEVNASNEVTFGNNWVSTKWVVQDWKTGWKTEKVLNNGWQKEVSGSIDVDDSHEFHPLSVTVTYSLCIPFNPGNRDCFRPNSHLIMIQVWDGSPIDLFSRLSVNGLSYDTYLKYNYNKYNGEVRNSIFI